MHELCKSKKEFMFFEAKPWEYYTTWSLLIVCISFICALVAASLKTFSPCLTLLIIVAIVGIANTVGVFAVSQGILAYAMRPNLKTKPSKPKGISIKLFEYINKSNYLIHLVPIIVAIFTLLLLCSKQSPTKQKTRILVWAICIQLALLLVYLVVPYSKDNNKFLFFRKLGALYGKNTHPVIYITGFLLCMSVLAGTVAVI